MKGSATACTWFVQGTGHTVCAEKGMKTVNRPDCTLQPEHIIQNTTKSNEFGLIRLADQGRSIKSP
jgi:hypothetical protein